MKPKKMLYLAAGVALSRIGRVQNFRFGTVGIRGRDGVIVASFNELAPEPSPRVHAESRLCQKLTPGSVIAVVRLLASGEWGMARPCENCQRCLKRAGVRRAYYSVAENEYGVMDF